MGFSCCKCSDKDLFKSTLIDPMNNQTEKPIEKIKINEQYNSDNNYVNSIVKNKYPTQRTSNKYKNYNSSQRRAKIADSKNDINNINNINILYSEEGIIDSLIRIRDK